MNTLSDHHGHLTDALQRSEERFRLMVEGVKEYAFYMIDPDGRVASWNAGAERIEGYKAHEVIGRHFSTFFLPHDVARGRPAAELKIAAEKGVFEEEGWRPRKDGTQFWASVVVTALRDESGELRGFTKLTRDITGRRTTQKLRQTEERFKLFTEAVKDYALFMLDPQGQVVSWNSGAARINGYSADEIIGHHFSRFYPAEDVERGKPDEELVIAARDGRYEEEGLRVRKDGSTFWAHVILSRVDDGAGRLQGFAKVTRDITQQKEAERKIRELNRTLEQRVAERTVELDATVARLQAAVEEKTLLLREVHHRVKNSLQVATSLLRVQSRALIDPAATAALQDGIRRIEAMGLVHQLLYGTDAITEVDFGEYLKRLADQLRFAEGRERQISVNMQSDGSHYDLDTAVPLALIAGEIITNVLKHAFPGGRQGTIDIATSSTIDHCILEIRDDGVGVPADAFEKRDKSFGLTLVRALAEQLDAKVTLDARGGTCFKVIFPKRDRTAYRLAASGP